MIAVMCCRAAPAMRLEGRIPGPGYFAVILPAGLLPLGRHLGLISQTLELGWVGADHQANDLIRALLAHTVLAVIDRLRPCFLIATGTQEPVLRRFREHVLGKVAGNSE